MHGVLTTYPLLLDGTKKLRTVEHMFTNSVQALRDVTRMKKAETRRVNARVLAFPMAATSVVTELHSGNRTSMLAAAGIVWDIVLRKSCGC